MHTSSSVDVYLSVASNPIIENCNGCHALNPSAGFFGTDGLMSIEGEPQEFKIPHLRNAYQKVGMFGMPKVAFFRDGDTTSLGAQVRGFGFLHDGSVDTLFRFHGAGVFSINDTERAQLEQFVLAFDSNLAPIVGQQITLTSTNAAAVGGRIDLLIARAAAGECDVVVKGNVGTEQRGWLRQANGQFRSDRLADPLLSDAALRAQAASAGQERTYTCVPPGSGQRIGVDRDEDGFFDRDELDAGSDPADPASVPAGGTTTTSTTFSSTTTSTTTTTVAGPVLIQTTALKLTDDLSLKQRFSFTSSSRNDGAPNRIVPPARLGPADPTVQTTPVTVVFYNSAGQTTDKEFYSLDYRGWRYLGTNTNPRGYAFRSSRVGGGPVRSVTITADKITIRGFGAYSLNEPLQGRIATRLFLGQRVWCADAPAKLTGHPPTTAKTDRSGQEYGGDQGEIHQHLHDRAANDTRQLRAVALWLDASQPRRVERKDPRHPFGQRGGDPGRQRIGESDEIRCQEGGHGRHRHRDGVEEPARDLQRHAERRDDERELPDLGEAHADAHGRTGILPGNERSQAAGEHLADDDRRGGDRNRPGVPDQRLRIEEQADRHEEDRAEHVADRLDQSLDRAQLPRLGHDRADHERAQRHAALADRRKHKRT